MLSVLKTLKETSLTNYLNTYVFGHLVNDAQLLATFPLLFVALSYNQTDLKCLKCLTGLMGHPKISNFKCNHCKAFIN